MVNEVLGMLDKVKKQHAEFVILRDQTHATHQQLIGAIHACDLLMKKLEEEYFLSSSNDIQCDNEETI